MSVEALNAPAATVEETGALSRTGVLRRLARDKVAAAAAIILTLIGLAAIFAPLVSPYDPYLTDLTKVMQPPNEQHWFGTDNTGRDILSRVIYGTRNTLMLGLVAGSEVHPVSAGPAAQSVADDHPGDHPGNVVVGRHHAPDAHHDA